MNSDANIGGHLSNGPIVMVNKTSLVSLSFFFTSIWWITVDMLVISVVEKYFPLGLKYLIHLKER